MEPFLLSVLLALAQGEAPGRHAELPRFDDGWTAASKKPTLPAPKDEVKPNPPSAPVTPRDADMESGFSILHQAPAEESRPAAVPKDGSSTPVNILVAIPPVPSAPVEVAVPATSAGADRWWLMRALQGTMYGKCLDDHRMYLFGWMGGSCTGSTANENNSPVVWNDRPNNFMLQQTWMKFGRNVVTTGVDPSFGFHIDVLYGTDYRYTLPRGFWNSQLLNSEWDPATDPFGTDVQNLYGFDMPQHYVNAYIPTLFAGTEFRIGRFYAPWGVEGIEMPSTPLISRSYAFNWCPPFTHCGFAAYITFNPEWSAVLMAVNGNDVYFGDPAAEWRFVGNLKWTQPGGKNTITLATSLGRGKFDEGEVFDVPGVAAIDEGGGRNHINVFDIVWTHLFNARLAYNMEMIYGYQTNVPGIFNSRGYGTAHWGSCAHYLFWTITPEVTGIVRFETFDDFQGQRTGVDALYTGLTTGLAYRPNKDMILRSEIRYDIANTGKPFNNGTDNQILTCAMDFILRW